MNLRSLVSGLVCMGFVACAGAQTTDEERAAEAVSPSYSYADVQSAPEAWREVDPKNLVVMSTSKGEIYIELLPAVADVHADQFRKYVKSGLYNNTVFHRVLKGFMAQGGDVAQAHGEDKMLEPMQGQFTFRRSPDTFKIDPIGPADGATGGYHLGFPIETQAQFLAEMSVDGMVESWIAHCPGVLSTARTDDKNSANAQFFLMTGHAPHLDRKYTAKGRILVGYDVAEAIKLGPDGDGYPISNPDVVTKAVLVSDLPVEDRPAAFVQRTDTPAWTTRLLAAREEGLEVCDLPQVPAIVIE